MTSADSGPSKPVKFKLFDRAKDEGIFTKEKGYLVSAPTATGKSYIGREVIKKNLANKTEAEVSIYLSPYKQLAEEAYSKFQRELPKVKA